MFEIPDEWKNDSMGLQEMEVRAAKAIAKSPNTVVEAKKWKTLKDTYLEFITPNIENVRKSLTDTFGAERHEFIVNKSPGFLKWLEENDKGSTTANTTFFKRCLNGVESACNAMRQVKAYVITIHFPKLTVRNSRGRKHEMVDMWIRMEMSPFLNDSHRGHGFTGMRTSYTLAEYTSQYNFSHMANNPEQLTWSRFCLGHTQFSTLCMSLANEFNANQFGLLLYQLEGYLSWESLEGTPYRSMGNISERGSSYANVQINSSERNRYYRKYLESGHTPNVEMISNPFYYGFTVLNDDQLREAITSVVDNDNHLQYWDSDRKVAVDRMMNNRNAAVDRAMNGRGGTTLFTFNGKEIKFVITDGSKKDEKGDNQKVAHTQIVNHVVTTLNQGLTKNTKNEFNKKRRVYVAG